MSLSLGVTAQPPATVIQSPAQQAAEPKTNGPAEPSSTASPSPNLSSSVVERYWQILRRNPRPGTAFDNWYNEYVDRGATLRLVEQLRKSAAADPSDANGQILLGLVLRRQGDLNAAEAAFLAASRRAPESHRAHVLLGQTLQQAQRFGESSAAFSIAIDLSLNAVVPPSERIGLYRDLARSQTLAGDTDGAAATWLELHRLFPQNERVQTEVASWLSGNERWSEALSVWRHIEQLSSDPYAKVKARLAMASVLNALNNSDEALKILDALLDQTKPGSGLRNEVYRQIEVVLRDGIDSQISFLSKRVSSNPEDLDSQVELSQCLSKVGRHGEAVSQMRATVERVPRNVEIRGTFVEILREANELDKAIEQIDRLVAQVPNDLEFLRTAGQLRLVAATRPYPVSLAEKVLEIWGKIPQIRPDDPMLSRQVADLCRNAAGIGGDRAADAESDRRYVDDPFANAALRYYSDAVRVASDPITFQEDLARFLRDTGRRDDATALFQQMVSADVEGEQWYQIALIERRLGFVDEALATAERGLSKGTSQSACYDLCVDICRESENYSKAVEYVDASLARLTNDRDVVRAVRKRVEILGEGKLLDRERRRLTRRVADATPFQWRDAWQLGLIYRSTGETERARSAFARVVQALPNEPMVLSIAAETDIAGGHVDGAVKKYHLLAKLEPHAHAHHFRRLIELYVAQDEMDEARELARELFATPATRASDCLDRAVVAEKVQDRAAVSRFLRQAVRVEPRNVDARIALTLHLADGGSTSEAMEHAWRAFQIVDDFEKKTPLLALMRETDPSVFKTTILPRLRNEVASNRQSRTSSLCLSDAYAALGMTDEATAILTRVLTIDPLDPIGVRRLAEIDMAADRPADAARRLQRLADVNDSRDVWQALLHAYVAADATENVIRVAKRLASVFGDDRVFVRLIDGASTGGTLSPTSSDRAVQYAKAAIVCNPLDWRVYVRLAVIAPQSEERLDALTRGLHAALVSPTLPEAAERQIDRTIALAHAGEPATISRDLLLHNQLRVVLHSRLPVFQEFNEARANAYRYVREQQIRQTSRRSTRPRNIGRVLPTDPFNGALFCWQVLKREGEASGGVGDSRGVNEPDALDDPRFATDQTAPILLRLRLVSMAADEKVWQNIDLFDRYSELRPDDPLPHLAKFYEGIPETSLEEQNEAHVQSLDESFAWLKRHYQVLSRTLSGQYAQQLVTARRYEAAAACLATQVDNATSISELVDLAPTCLNVDLPVFRERFLTRALELSNAPGTIPEDLGDVLMVAFSEPFRRYKATEWVAVLALLEKHLASSTESGRARSVTTARTFQSPSAANRQVSEALVTAISDPSISSAQKQALLQFAQRQRAMAYRNQNARSQVGFDHRQSADKIITSSNPYLSHYQREILSRALEQARNSADEDMLLSWLKQKAADRGASVTQRLAYPLSLWLSGRRAPATAELAKLSKAFPQDVHLRLLAASAAFEMNQLDQSFLMLSDPSLQGSRVESDMILLQSQLNSSLAKLKDYDIGLRCLLAVMERQTIPYLYPFFSRHNRQSVDMTGSAPAMVSPLFEQASNRDDWRLSGTQQRAAVILGILDRAWQLDNVADRVSKGQSDAPSPSVDVADDTPYLKRLGDLVAQSLVLYPRNRELAALEILLALRQQDTVAANERIAQWQRSSTFDEWTSATTAEVAMVLCRIPETRTTGYEFASQYIIGNAVQGAKRRGSELLRDVTFSISDSYGVAGAKAENDRKIGKAFWESYFQVLQDRCQGKTDATSREITTEAISILTEAAPDTIPAALQTLARIAGEPHGDHFLPRDIGPAIASTVQRANLHWLHSDRRLAFEALLELVFPDGLQKTCRSWNWYEFPDATSELSRFSLGSLVVTLGHETKQLGTIRPQLEASPFADTPEIVAFRLEIAKLDNDLATLMPLLADTRKRQTPNPPVWSAELVKQVDPDLKAVSTAVRQSGVITLSDDQEYRTAATLPSYPFYVKRLRMKAPEYKDPGLQRFQRLQSIPNLRDIGRLRHLTELSLTNFNVTDGDLSTLLPLSQLTRLELDGARVTDEGLERLATLETLKTLSVRQTEVTAQGVARFQAMRPHCKVIWATGP